MAHALHQKRTDVHLLRGTQPGDEDDDAQGMHEPHEVPGSVQISTQESLVILDAPHDDAHSLRIDMQDARVVRGGFSCNGMAAL